MARITNGSRYINAVGVYGNIHIYDTVIVSGRYYIGYTRNGVTGIKFKSGCAFEKACRKAFAGMPVKAIARTLIANRQNMSMTMSEINTTISQLRDICGK